MRDPLRIVRHAVCVVVGSAVVTLVAACDVRPDECSFADNACEGSVANECFRPAPDSRLELRREDCGADRTCVLGRARDPNQDVSPVCAEKGAPDCATLGERICRDGAVAECAALVDGRKTWVDEPCADGCRVDPTYGAECVY